MNVGVLKPWTPAEDYALTEEFYKQSINFKGRWKPAHAEIKRQLQRRGINRTEKAISRRLYRLKLHFFKVRNGEIIKICNECKSIFFVQERYIKPPFNKTICNPCALKHRHDWNKLNRAETLQYYKDYNKTYTKKRMDK